MDNQQDNYKMDEQSDYKMDNPPGTEQNMQADLPPGELTNDDKLWGMLSHLLTFCGSVVPFGNFIAPLVIMLTQKDKSEYVVYHAKESLNAQISYTVYIFAASLLCFVLIGFLILPVVTIACIVYIIIAGIRANEGERYRYPFIFRLIN